MTMCVCSQLKTGLTSFDTALHCFLVLHEGNESRVAEVQALNRKYLYSRQSMQSKASKSTQTSLQKPQPIQRSPTETEDQGPHL